IHFTGLSGGKPGAHVQPGTIAEFAAGGTVWMRPYDPRQCFSPDLVVANAEYLVSAGHGNYDLITNNCEHIATWCKTGRPASEQVIRVRSAVVGSVGAGALIAGGIGAAGAVAAPWVSGAAQLTSGLATLGGRAIVGLGLISAASAASAVAAFWHAMRDDHAQPPFERVARGAARAAALVAAGVSRDPATDA